jgi:hypothetical protein
MRFDNIRKVSAHFPHCVDEGPGTATTEESPSTSVGAIGAARPSLNEVETATFDCHFCDRSFGTESGASLHEKSVHPAAYNERKEEEIASRVSVKPRWSEADRFLLKQRLGQTTEADRKDRANLWQVLALSFPGRTPESIKRQILTIADLRDTLSALDASPEQSPPAVQGGTQVEDTQLQNSNTDHDFTILQAIRSAAFECSQSEEGPVKVLGDLLDRVSGGANPSLEAVLKQLEELAGPPRTRSAQRKPPTAPAAPRGRGPSNTHTSEYKKVQQLWSKNKKACYEYVMTGARYSVDFSPETASNYWGALFGRESPPDEAPTVALCNPPSSQLWRAVTTDEVAAAVRSLGNSAPGLDEIDPIRLRRVPTAALVGALNYFLFVRKLPPSLKKCRTILIPKTDGGRSDPSQCRPITIGSVVVRVLHSVLATRLKFNLRFSSEQRGFIPGDGVCQNIQLLDHLIYSCRRRSREMFAAVVDVRKAFDSVSHNSIVRACRNFGLPAPMIQYIQDFYSGLCTFLDVGGCLSGPLAVRRGVCQGDPLSPLLFNMVVDEILRKLPTEVGVSIEDAKVSHLAFADDLILVSHSEAGLQHLIGMVESDYADRGLELNPQKTVTFGYRASAKFKQFAVARAVRVKVAGETPASVSVGEAFTYLGVRFQTNGRLRPNLDEFDSRLEKLKAAKLKPNQKVYLLRQFLLPEFGHELVLSRLSSGLLEAWDRSLRRFVRGVAHLPDQTPNSFLHCPIRLGGLGVPLLRNWVVRCLNNRLEKLKESENPTVQAFVKTEHYHKQLTQLRARLATAKISKRGRVMKAFTKNESEQATVKELMKQRDGFGFAEFGRTPVANAWIAGDTPYCSGGKWVNMIKLRINALPCGANAHRDGTSAPCRYGCVNQYGARGFGDGRETLNHILAGCRSLATRTGRLARHSALRDRLAGMLREQGFDVRTEVRLQSDDPSCQEVAQPDLIVRKDSRIFILDCAIGTESSVAWSLSKLATTKSSLYGQAWHARAARQIFGAGEKAHVSARGIVFGGRGAVESTSVATMLELGLSKRQVLLLAVIVLERSLKTYKLFMQGDRPRRAVRDIGPQPASGIT